MTASQFVIGFVRLAAIVLPAVTVAHRLRTRYLGVSGCLAVLAEVLLALSTLLVVAELLGLVSLDRPAALIPLLIVLAAACEVFLREAGTSWRAWPAGSSARKATVHGLWSYLTLPSAVVAVVVVTAQWCLATADSLGAGMASFDTLWYHMPFAARFAQTGSVTGIQFTQADPFVAYYPANSELFHGIGIAALRNDFLSPVINLGWLALGLLASWCVGRPWRVERLTLISGCLVFALPVLATTQPGQAFNDSAGLATLLAAAALVANKPDDIRVLAVAGLGLGLAAGTKFTFVVPALVLVAALVVSAPRGARARVLASLTLPGLLTAGWWYLRNVIEVGNPLGVKLHLGPVTLPGPVSPLANALRETVLSEMTRGALWSSRIVPGLSHAIGPLWPLLLLLCLAATVVGMLVTDRVIRAIAVAAALTAITYVLLPVGARAAQGTVLFEVQLRFLTPALALALPLVPILVRLRDPRALPALGLGLVTLLVASQLVHALWPTQPARHLVFLLAVAGLAVLISLWRMHRPRTFLHLAATAIPVPLLVGGASFAAQHHYFNRRYIEGSDGDVGLGQIYRWAQGVAHARIALYGTLLQYPLYGSRDTNDVGYLGEPAPSRGFRPIRSCRTWRTTLAEGGYKWVVIVLPGPTAAVPIAWTRADPAMKLILHPEAGAFVYRVEGPTHPQLCTSS
jgi:hypothetical protein